MDKLSKEQKELLLKLLDKELLILLEGRSNTTTILDLIEAIQADELVFMGDDD